MTTVVVDESSFHKMTAEIRLTPERYVKLLKYCKYEGESYTFTIDEALPLLLYEALDEV